MTYGKLYEDLEMVIGNVDNIESTEITKDGIILLVKWNDFMYKKILIKAELLGDCPIEIHN
mgnify:CR=1 FL=1